MFLHSAFTFTKGIFGGLYFATILVKRAKINMWNLEIVIAHAQLTPGPNRTVERKINGINYM